MSTDSAWIPTAGAYQASGGRANRRTLIHSAQTTRTSWLVQTTLAAPNHFIHRPFTYPELEVGE